MQEQVETFDPVKNGEQIKQQIEQAIEAEIECIVWDLETTGFVAPECKILEIGCFIVNGENVEHKHWVLNNVGHEIPEKITELTGITQAIIDAEGRDPKECLLEFLPLFKRCKKNVTHNGVRFDIPFLLDYAAHVLEFTPEQKMAVANLIRSTAYDTAVAYKAKAIFSSRDKNLAIFETKIENSTKSKWTDFEARYSTYDEALKGHENAVLQVKKRFK